LKNQHISDGLTARRTRIGSRSSVASWR